MVKFNKGFTLIEMMVVVVIIGLLAMAATMVYTKGQARAKDARRSEDIANIMDGLKMYYQQHYNYPTENNQCAINGSADVYDSSNCDGRGDWLGDSSQYLDVYNDLVLNGYLKFMPKDPVNDFGYEYRYEPYGATSDECANIECVDVLIGALIELPQNGGSGICFTTKATLDPNWQSWCDNL